MKPTRHEHVEKTLFGIGSSGNLSVEVRRRQSPDKWEAVWRCGTTNPTSKFLIEATKRIDAWMRSVQNQSRRAIGIIGVRLCAYSPDHTAPVVLLWLSTESYGTPAARLEIPCRIVRIEKDTRQLQLGTDPSTGEGDVENPQPPPKAKAKKHVRKRPESTSVV